MHYYDGNGYSRGEREKIFTTWGGGGGRIFKEEIIRVIRYFVDDP